VPNAWRVPCARCATHVDPTMPEFLMIVNERFILFHSWPRRRARPGEREAGKRQGECNVAWRAASLRKSRRQAGLSRRVRGGTLRSPWAGGPRPYPVPGPMLRWRDGTATPPVLRGEACGKAIHWTCW
jgi:hypothetical protein